MNYVNFHRYYQATFMLPYLKEASLKSGEAAETSKVRAAGNAHRVVMILGRMMAPPEKPDAKTKRSSSMITDTCFPSLYTLAEETAVSESTVRRALDDLLAWGIITKTMMPNYRPPRPDQKWQPTYDHCRYHLVPELWDRIETPFSSTYGKPREQAKVKSKVAAPVATAEDVAGAATIDMVAQDAPLPKKRSAQEQKMTQETLVLLRERFPSHNSWSLENADGRVVGSIHRLLDKSDAALNILHWRFRDDEIVEEAKRWDHLGAFLEKNFDEWATDYKPAFEKGMRDTLVEIAVGDTQEPMPSGCQFTEEFPPFAERILGDHLRSIRPVPADDGDGGVIWEIDMTPEAKIALIIGNATNTVIEPDDVDDDVDDEAVRQAVLWATKQDLKKDLIERSDGDPLAYFMEHKHEADWDDVVDSDEPEQPEPEEEGDPNQRQELHGEMMRQRHAMLVGQAAY